MRIQVLSKRRLRAAINGVGLVEYSIILHFFFFCFELATDLAWWWSELLPPSWTPRCRAAGRPRGAWTCPGSPRLRTPAPSAPPARNGEEKWRWWNHEKEGHAHGEFKFIMMKIKLFFPVDIFFILTLTHHNTVKQLFVIQTLVLQATRLTEVVERFRWILQKVEAWPNRG